ncbi:Fe(3+) ABC transporter substrate-binding protein [Telmatospirillum sp. J64-1]|uniref:Fe(3+) ABC transporter substrate-binding protein n=1 Tax=Telmatospirillum sp. J64-1 TaxID=2502183 RepID=UPI00115DCAAD|nr:Fe(3+) ABC transporter substrate-binding protein [Telmatospirillum sp. J64-1]
MRLHARLIGFAVAAATVAGATAVQAAEVNVYSSRQDHLIKPLLDQYSESTGVQVNLLSGSAEQLIERLKNEGANSPADVLITVDVGNLHSAKMADVLQPISSPVLDSNVPANYRDSDGNWYGLSRRARVIFYSKDRVQPSELSTYEALAGDEWKGRICIRSSGNIYNQSLLAAMIATEGEEKAEAWAKGIAENMARQPQGGDRDQIKAVAAGECDVAIANTYYFGNMAASDNAEDKAVVEKIGVFFPNQGDRGTHVNLSGAGVTKASKNKEEAIKLIEYLTSDEAQEWYAQVNSEYPVKPGVAVSPILASWGEFKADAVQAQKLGENNAAAVRIFDRVGWR